MTVLPHLKKYLAILRDGSPEELTIDYNLIHDNNIKQNAQVELEFNNKPTSRYCLAAAIPETGRMHQLRKHFKHIFIPF